MDTEPYFSTAFLLICLIFYIRTMRHVDRELNHDQQRLVIEQDKDYDRMVREADDYGFEGSRLQKYIARNKK